MTTLYPWAGFYHLHKYFLLVAAPPYSTVRLPLTRCSLASIDMANPLQSLESPESYETLILNKLLSPSLKKVLYEKCIIHFPKQKVKYLKNIQ